MLDQKNDMVLLGNTGDGRYPRYFAELDQALGMVSSWAKGWSGGALIASEHSDYLRGLAACNRMLQSRFNFETNDSLMVDSRSGYPHSYMLARIANDRAEAITEHLVGDKLTASQLKQVFLDDLFANGTVNRALLNRIACAKYAEVVAGMDGAFDPRFTCGTPKNGGVEKGYRLQWSTFDPTLNLPVLCGMVFEYSGRDLTGAMAGLKLVLKHETKAGMSVSALAHYIDTATTDIHPVALSRVILGPLHLPGLTEQSAPCALPSVELGKSIVIDLTVDHTHSVSVKKPSSIAIRLGVSPAEQQVYSIRITDPLCEMRGAHSVERIVILPHRMLQSMGAAHKKDDMGGFTLVPYIKEGELQ